MSEKGALVEQCAELIRSLNLEVLDRTWVAQIIDSEFTENPEIPGHNLILKTKIY